MFLCEWKLYHARPSGSCANSFLTAMALPERQLRKVASRLPNGQSSHAIAAASASVVARNGTSTAKSFPLRDLVEVPKHLNSVRPATSVLNTRSVDLDTGIGPSFASAI